METTGRAMGSRKGLIHLETKEFVNEMWKISEIENTDVEKKFEEHDLEGWLSLDKISDGDVGGFYIPKLGIVSYAFDVRLIGEISLSLVIQKIEGRCGEYAL
ncbi:MAG: hypothetical protein ACRCU6_00285 [Fusobacteriaceae bacterium]